MKSSQFGRLFESVTNGDFGENPIPDFQDNSKVTTQPKITDQDGEPKEAKPVNTDKFADMQSPQQWGSVGGRKSSNTI